MSENLRVLRFYFLLLAIFTVGRWSMGFAGVPYEKGHHVFSIVILTLIAAAHHGAFARRFLGYRFWAAVGLAVTLAFTSQVVIWLSTLISYLAGLHTYFNYPTALNVTEAIPLGQAMVARTITLVANCVTGGIAGALGFALGAALPERK
jgi:hypothetical protein